MPLGWGVALRAVASMRRNAALLERDLRLPSGVGSTLEGPLSQFRYSIEVIL